MSDLKITDSNRLIPVAKMIPPGGDEAVSVQGAHWITAYAKAGAELVEIEGRRPQVERVIMDIVFDRER